MEALLAYVRRTEICLLLAEQLAGFALVQGVHVEPHPDVLRDWITQRRGPGWRTDEWPFGIQPLDVPIDPALDFDAASKWLSGERLPLLVRVHLCPDRAGESSEDMRRKILDIVGTFLPKIDIVLEDRARTVAAMQPGDKISETLPGTGGGFLSDGTDLFGVTCAHVARLGNLVRDHKGEAIGPVVAASPLSVNSAGTLCRPDSRDANEMDAALFEYPAPAPPPSGLVVSSAYGSAQRALMRGAVSGGPNSYYFGSLGLTHTVDIADAGTGLYRPHCFHLLNSIRPVAGFWPWACWPNHRAQRGDSGAFITDVNGALWFGMLCAVDGTEGFFLDATRVLEWIRRATHRPMLTPY